MILNLITEVKLDIKQVLHLTFKNFLDLVNSFIEAV